MSILTRLRHYLPLVIVILVAASLRWLNLNWDDGFHLHPDERFLTMVQLDLKLPATLANYFDPNTSTLNPQNAGHNFYVYGMLPLTVNKFLATVRGTDTYDLATLQGRFLSGLADIGTVILVYCLGQLLTSVHQKSTHSTHHPHHVGLWAAGLYAIAVLPIQLSHFFAVDSFLVFFATASVWASWRYVFKSNWRYLTQAGIFFGLALACKLTAIFIVPLVGAALLLAAFVHNRAEWHLKFSGQKFAKTILSLGWWLVVAYVTVRLASPNYFAVTSWLNPHLNPRFIQSLTELKSFETDSIWYPPGVQWIHKPPGWFALKNLALYGVGLPWFGLAVLGMGVVLKQSWQNWRHRSISIMDLWWLVLLGWTISFFGYQSIQFVKVMRYFILLYPALALLAGLGFSWLISQVANWHRFKSLLVSHLILASLIVSVLIWPAAFMSIYLHLHSRVLASIWLDQNLPNHSYILSEYWDDPLPLTLPGMTKTFTGTQANVFDADTPGKWAKLNQDFATADYYVLSSNRAWGSIMPLPDKYPQMAEYYRRLLAGQTDWELVKTVTSYPSLRYLGLPIDFNTDSADEAFTVYDHPKVLIFAKPDHAQSLLVSQPLFAKSAE